MDNNIFIRKCNKFFFIVTTFIVISVLSACSDEHQSDDISVEQNSGTKKIGLESPIIVSPKGYVDSASVWQNNNISVCWQNLTAANLRERDWVRLAVENTWEATSRVNFTGWGVCNNATNIRIQISDQGPHVRVLGSGLNRVGSGMVLNFTFQNWSTSCQTSLKYCIEVIAVHEFGHALGFAHEQNRPDTPDWCDEDQGSNGTVHVGLWDRNSIMNYCSTFWNNQGNLSTVDVSTVQTYYGAPILTNDNFQIWSASFPTGEYSNSYRHHFGDINGDGRDDLVQFSAHSTSGWIGLANASGNFNIWTHSVPTGELGGTYTHHLADVNGDNRTDLIQFGRDTGWVGIANASGAFQIWTYTIPTGRYGTTYRHYFADTNGDGRSDLVQIGNTTTGWVGIADVNGDIDIWTHSFPTGEYSGRYRQQLADVNGDGRADLIQFGNEDYFNKDRMWIGLANASGNFQIWTHSLLNTDLDENSNFYIEDVNGDGRSDLIQVNLDHAYGRIALGQADGQFDFWSHSFAAGEINGEFAHKFADVNADGRTDIIQLQKHGGEGWIGLGNASGNFDIWNTSFATGEFAGIYTHHLADVNGDNRADLIQMQTQGVSGWIGLSQ